MTYTCDKISKKSSSSMQVCIADIKRKDQKDDAHDNLIMTSGSKFGMPAFQVADLNLCPYSWHSHSY